MDRTSIVRLLSGCALLGLPPAALADHGPGQEGRPEEARAPGSEAARQEGRETPAPKLPARVFHPPIQTASAGQDLHMTARVEGDWRLSDLAVHLRPAGSEEPCRSFPLVRTRSSQFEAIVPGSLVQPPGLLYFIASRGPQGEPRMHFGSDKRPFPISVHGDSEETLLAEHLEVWEGRRSSLRLRAELTAFGSRLELPKGGGDAQESDRFTDRYWVTEIEYRYRLLRILYDVSFGVTVMRSELPTVNDASSMQRASHEEQPGINFAYGGVTLAMHRYLSVGGRLILGASAEGFIAGLGVDAYLGRMAGTHFAFSVDTVGDVGTRVGFCFRWLTVPRVPMALGLVFTNWPAQEDSPLGTILSYDLGWKGWPGGSIMLRTGLATRSESLNNGFHLGMALQQDF